METLAQIYKALSEEIRLRIVMLLMQGELCVCDLMDIFGEPQSKISRHLAYLKHSGLIKGWRVGVWMHYDLKESLDESWMNQLNFMKEKLSYLPEFMRDRDTLIELKKQKNCKAAMESKTGNQSKQDRSNRLRGK
jgi:ArsR family transcriptional regulator, arsenate/arsenite/antimonite-responsive transcriptional repressor